MFGTQSYPPVPDDGLVFARLSSSSDLGISGCLLSSGASSASELQPVPKNWYVPSEQLCTAGFQLNDALTSSPRGGSPTSVVSPWSYLNKGETSSDEDVGFMMARQQQQQGLHNSSVSILHRGGSGIQQDLGSMLQQAGSKSQQLRRTAPESGHFTAKGSLQPEADFNPADPAGHCPYLGGRQIPFVQKQQQQYGMPPAAAISYVDSFSRGSSPPAMLPASLTVQADTDPYALAGMLTCIFSQQGTSHCALALKADRPSTDPAQHPHQSAAAARIALMAVQIAGRTLSSSAQCGGSGSNSSCACDVAIVPYLCPDGSVGLLALCTSLPAAIWQAQGQVLPLSRGDDLLVKGLEISGGLTCAGGGQQIVVDLVYEPQAALLLLQATAVARINLEDGSGRDVMVLPMHTCGGTGGGGGGEPLSSGLLHGGCLQGGDQLHHVKLVPAGHVLSSMQLKQLMAAVQQLNAAPPGLDWNLAQQQQQQEQQQQQQHETLRRDSMSRQTSAAYAAGSSGAAADLAPDSSAFPQGRSAAAAAAAVQPVPNPHQLQAAGMLQEQQSRQQQQAQRARKADYVIVTEDTAVKNAAGAIAKVLGRVCDQGLPCPVYTERKTENVAGVISVAVKAIAVARGYIANEGGGHQVAFQPYLRHQTGVPPGSDTRDMFERRSAGAILPSQDASSATMRGHHHQAPLLARSAENTDVDPSDLALTDTRSELAFDVFKVHTHLLPVLPESTNLPVKVTAHSRSSVVSNIIAKLVSERGSVVLITAGGRAMHVAMMAVVAARARLRAGRSAAVASGAAAARDDLLLLPRFVTVDTTDTLGWESVFLRFTIVRAPGVLLGSEQQQQLPHSAVSPAASELPGTPMLAGSRGGWHQPGGQMGMTAPSGGCSDGRGNVVGMGRRSSGGGCAENNNGCFFPAGGRGGGFAGMGNGQQPRLGTSGSVDRNAAAAQLRQQYQLKMRMGQQA